MMWSQGSVSRQGWGSRAGGSTGGNFQNRMGTQAHGNAEAFAVIGRRFGQQALTAILARGSGADATGEDGVPGAVNGGVELGRLHKEWSKCGLDCLAQIHLVRQR
jgi:hypothetical protein